MTVTGNIQMMNQMQRGLQQRAREQQRQQHVWPVEGQHHCCFSAWCVVCRQGAKFCAAGVWCAVKVPHSVQAGISPHLTSLALRVAEGWRPVSSCRAALASLTSLRELIIGGEEERPLGPDTPVFNELAPALQHLTRPTALDLAPGQHTYGLGSQELHGSHLQLLPACLVDLAAPLRPRADEPLVDMGHLTAVTQLYVENFQAGYVLPPNVKDLRLFDSVSLLPLFERGPPLLNSLSLVCEGDVFEVPAAARLQQLSQVTSLSVSVHVNTLGGLDAFPVLLEALPCLQELVVRSPTVIAPIAVIASSRRQLTGLTFIAMCEGPAVRALAAFVSQLAGLRRLQWTAVYDRVDKHGEEYDAQPLATQANWQALCVAVAKLQSLRQILLVRCELGGAAAAKLGAATQLTQVTLRWCGVDDATRLCSLPV